MKFRIYLLTLVMFMLMPFQAGMATDRPVKKVLSLDLCTDWILAKYASPSQVVALSPLTKMYPVEWIDSSWPTHDGNLEHIIDLDPDLVITGEYNAIQLRHRLRELGVRVQILTLPKRLSQVNAYIQRLLSLIQKSGEITNQSFTVESIEDVKKQQSLLMLGANGIGTGRQTFEDDILHHAGWNNYLKDNGYINLDLEKIATTPPDAILWSAPATRALSNLFASHPALKHSIPTQQWLTTDAWKWQCPGPWSWELVKDLRSKLPS